MRILINQKHEKEGTRNAKFFEMAAVFAREYNKWVPDEEKARIVLPYSFLLNKAKVLFPECLAAVTVGQPESKFITRVNEDPDLFEFVFTSEDKALYKELYDRLHALLRENNALRAKYDAQVNADKHVGVMSEAAVNALRTKAVEINSVLELLGQNPETWFADHKIGNGSSFPALKANSEGGKPVSGPGLYLALLQMEDSRKQLGLSQRKLAPISPETTDLYTGLFEKSDQLVSQINDDIFTRQTQAASAKKTEKMGGRKIEKPKISKDKMNTIVKDAIRLKGFLHAVDQEWLEANGVCSKGQLLEADSISGPALFSELLAKDHIRNKLKVAHLIDEATDKAISDLALGHESHKEITVYAVDDKDFYEKATGVVNEASLNPDYRSAIDAADGDKRVVTELLKTKRRNAIVKTTRMTNPLAEKDEDKLAFFDVIKSGQLYDNLYKRLQRLANGHPEREASIMEAVIAMKTIIGLSGHTGVAEKFRSSVNGEAELLKIVATGPENKKDPEALQEFVDFVKELLEAYGEAVPSKVRAALKNAITTTENLIPNVQRGGRSKSAGTS